MECWNFTDDSKHTIPAGTEITLEYSQDADNTIVSTEGIETADGRTAYRFIVPNEKLTKVTGAKIVYCHNPARWLYQRDQYLLSLIHISVAGVVRRTRYRW